MGRNPCCSKEGLNRGAWTAAEDKILVDYIKIHGEGKWRNVPKKAGLKRCGKSCRLRWLNYLRPDIKRGNISHDEEELIIRLHKLLGNRWSLIAGRLPGRTDNEIKNYWNTNIGKKLLQDHLKQSQSPSSSSRKPSYQCQASPNLAIENSKSQSPKVETGSSLIKTKASTCKKVIIAPQEPQKIDHDELMDTKQPVACAGPSMVDVSVDNDHNVIKGHESSLPEFNLQHENNLSDDFMMDLQMDDHLLSFLNGTDFSQLSYLDNNGGKGHSNTINIPYDQGCSLSPNSDQTLLFSEEKNQRLHGDSDFPSMESLIGSEFDWFRD